MSEQDIRELMAALCQIRDLSDLDAIDHQNRSECLADIHAIAERVLCQPRDAKRLCEDHAELQRLREPI